MIHEKPVRHALGAEELVELGKTVPQYRYSHSPYLAGRPQLGRSGKELFQPNLLGQASADDLETYLSAAASRSIGVLDDLLGDEPDRVESVGDLLAAVPASVALLAQVLLLGNAVLAFQIRIDGKRELSETLSAIASALSTSSPSENQIAIDQAKDAIILGASGAMQDDVRKILDGVGVSGQNLTPAVSGAGT